MKACPRFSIDSNTHTYYNNLYGGKIMNILFCIVFVIMHEIFATIGGVIMALLPNWVVIIMCEVAIGFGASTITKKFFSKKNISSKAMYVCLILTVAACVLNIYSNGFSIPLVAYNIVGCIAVYTGLFDTD